MSGQDAQEWRDDVSIWCYDGQCVQCTDDAGCEHHCHVVDEPAVRAQRFIQRGLTLVGLSTWSVIGLWMTADDLEVNGMTRSAIKGGGILVAALMTGSVLGGLREQARTKKAEGK